MNKDKLRITVVVDWDEGYVCGATLLPYLTSRKLSQRGHDVVILTSTAKGKKRVEQKDGLTKIRFRGVKVPGIKGDAKITMPNVLRIYNILKTQKSDVVFLHYPTPLCTVTAIAAKTLGIPVAVISHTQPENLLKALNLNSRTIRNLLYKYIVMQYNLADVMMCQSKFAAESLIKQGMRKPVYLCGGAIPLKKFEKCSNKEINRVRKRYNIKGDPIILYLGRLAREKRIDVLLKALRYLIPKYPNIRMLIVGEGPIERKLHSLTKRLGLEDYVMFTGFVPDEDVAPLYHLSTFYVLPSEVELLSLSTLHAMASSKPVVVADSPESATPSLVDGNGYLFKPGNARDLADKVHKLVSSGKIKEFGRRSRELAKPHDIEKTIEQYERLFYRLRSKKKTIS